MRLRDRVGLTCVVVGVFVQAGSARAADLSLGQWTYSWNSGAQINASVPINNDGPTNSGPLTITLWATTDPRDSTVLTQGFRLVQVTVDEGVFAFDSIEVSSGFQSHVDRPDPGTYNIAVTVDESGLDASPRLLDIGLSQLTFPLPTAPSESAIRSRVASAIPCGSLFVPFSLATFVGLCLTKWATRSAGRR